MPLASPDFCFDDFSCKGFSFSPDALRSPGAPIIFGVTCVSP
jgi:hypothetical protein